MENRPRILEAYTNHLREHGTPPHTVHAFCKSLDLSERNFFEEFASLDSVESAIWSDWIASVAAKVSGGPEWQEFSARHRYLDLPFRLHRILVGLAVVDDFAIH
jgi:hypothetical protein